jgi:hypothetical protein
MLVAETHWVAPLVQAPTHVPPGPQQKPVPHVPLPAAPHAPVHTPAAHVGVAPEHAVHAPPGVPHVLF